LQLLCTLVYPVSSHTCSFSVWLPDVCSYSVHLCIPRRLAPVVFLSGCLMFAVTLYTCVSHVVSHLQFSCTVAWCLQLLCTLVFPVSSHTCSFSVWLPDVCSYSVRSCSCIFFWLTCNLPFDSPDVWCHWSSPDNFTYCKISKSPTAMDFKLGFRPLNKYFFCLMFFNNISISSALTFLFNGVFDVDLLYYVAVEVRWCYSLGYRYLKRR